MANGKNWQCCFKRRSRDADMFHVLSFYGFYMFQGGFLYRVFQEEQ
jgi:hypothetical protein